MTDDGRPTVLIAEDEEMLLESFQIWLSEEYEVRTAVDGEEALDAMDETVDVALLDRRMPRQTGDEVLAQIRANGYDCQVAMVTAVDPDFDIIEMGFDTYLTKPISKDDLLETVATLVSLSAYADESQRLYSVIQKQLTLEEELPAAELEASEEYEQLKARRQRLEERAQASMNELDHDTVAAAFRDLSGEPET